MTRMNQIKRINTYYNGENNNFKFGHFTLFSFKFRHCEMAIIFER